MKTRLFQESISAYGERQVQQAVAKVENLSEADLLDPGLAGTVEKIADDIGRFKVAQLEPESRRGTRRVEGRAR